MLMRAEKLYNKWGSLLLAGLALLILLTTLFGGETIGLSDNGDYARIMPAHHIAHFPQPHAFVFTPRFLIETQAGSTAARLKELLLSTAHLDFYPSIQHLFVRIAVVTAFLFGSLSGDGSVFSIGYLGVLYSVLYALVLWALFSAFRLRNIWADLAGKLAALIVLCDVGYSAYFNSFYSEPVQMIAFLAMAVCLLRVLTGGRPARAYLLFCLSAVLFGWSKFANIPVSALCVICVGVPLMVSGSARDRARLIPAAAASLAVLCAITVSVPAWMSRDTDYNAVFYGALKDVPEEAARAYADELGLADYADLAGTHAYLPNASAAIQTPEFQSAFHVSKVRMTMFYLRHSGYFLKKLTTSVNSAGFVRPYYLSNYDSSHPRLTLSGRFSLWSSLRQASAFDTWWLNLAVSVAAAALLCTLLRGRDHDKLWCACLLVMLVGTLAYDLASPILCNGEADLAKHLFSFVQVTDLLILFDLIAAIHLLGQKRARPLAAAALAVLCVMLLYPTGRQAVSALRAAKAHDAIEPGSYVALGSADGNALVWLVSETNDGSATLIAADPVSNSAFSAANSNLWTDSDLRAWLNGPFLQSFTAEELEHVLTTRNRFVLSESNHALTQDGSHPFFAFHTPRQAARGEDTAYAAYAEDTVRLPELSDVCGAMRLGCRISPCWLETPYDSNGQMVRILSPDGYLYMRDAEAAYGVVPCLTVSGEAISGSGSRSDPFRLC